MNTPVLLRESGYVRTRPSFVRDSPPYTCPELERNPGLDDKRFEAFSIPSLSGTVEKPIRRSPVRNPKTQILIEWKNHE